MKGSSKSSRNEGSGDASAKYVGQRDAAAAISAAVGVAAAAAAVHTSRVGYLSSIAASEASYFLTRASRH
eukprot:5394847-Prymnesium_polylepis.1